MTLPRLEIPPHVADIIRHLPPDLKRSIKAASRSLATQPAFGEPLMGELQGLWEYRVRRFRVVYEVDRGQRLLRVHALGHRRRVYDDLTDQVRRKK